MPSSSGECIQNMGVNQITTIDENVFKGLTALQGLYLIENPLNCNNCKMQQIKIFLQNLTFPNLAAATMCDGGTLLFNYEFDNCTGPTEYSTDTTTSTSVISTTQETTTGITTATITTSNRRQPVVNGRNTVDTRNHG
ncbi:Hypothetical predicted protein, partial [Mytilus galloprovincialis]